MTTAGMRRSSARSSARVIFSPATHPIEPADEPKIGHGNAHRVSVYRGHTADNRVEATGLRLRGFPLVGVVWKVQRITRPEVSIDLLEAAGIERDFDALLRTYSMMKSAVRAHVEELFKLSGEQNFFAVRALLKSSFSGQWRTQGSTEYPRAAPLVRVSQRPELVRFRTTWDVGILQPVEPRFP